MMREKREGKVRKLAEDKLMRQIKMAEVQKQKEAELEKAQIQASIQRQKAREEGEGGDGDEFKRLVERNRHLYPEMSYKQAYSGPVFVKRHLINAKRLKDFLDRHLYKPLDESTVSMASGQDLSYATTATEMQKEQQIKGMKDITYGMLLENLEQAEQNYQNIRAQREGRLSEPKAKRQKSKAGMNMARDNNKESRETLATRDTSHFRSSRQPSAAVLDIPDLQPEPLIVENQSMQDIRETAREVIDDLVIDPGIPSQEDGQDTARTAGALETARPFIE